MNKKEFFAAVNLYKRQSEIVQWKNDFLPKAIAASAKEILAHSTGNDEDAMAFANELASYTKKLDWLPDSEFSKISSLIEHSAEEMAEKYGATFDDGVLEHGTKWKDHKYIRIENGRYIYPEDLKARQLRKDAAGQEKGAKSELSNAKLSESLIKYGKDIDGSPISSNKEESAKLQKWADQGKAWSAGMQAQAKGMIRKAEELEKVADKKRLDDRASDLAKANEQRKADNTKAVASAGEELRKNDDSARKAQAEGEAMQAWKNAKAAAEVRKGDNSAEKAQSSMAGYEEWKKQKEESSKGEMVTEKTSAGPITKYVSNNKKANDIYGKLRDEMNDGKSAKDAFTDLTQDVDEDTAYEILKMILPGASKEYYDAMYMNTRKNRLGHSFDLSTKEGYYAAIEEYKRKKV